MNQSVRTHWDGCWKSHLECAKARITELEQVIRKETADTETMLNSYANENQRFSDHIAELEQQVAKTVCVLKRELAAATEIKKRSENLLSALRCTPMSWPQKQIKALYEVVGRAAIDAARKEGK